jgi:exosome complex component RRP40
MDSTLGGLEFDGVTKKNKPNLKVGAVVFCRVLQYSKHTGGQLSCMNKGISNRKGNLLGELK